MMLGDLIADLIDKTAVEELLLSVADLAMLADLRSQAAANGLELGEYAARVAARYASDAPEEEWVTLMGAMANSSDPGKTYLKRAFTFARDRGASE